MVKYKVLIPAISKSPSKGDFGEGSGWDVFNCTVSYPTDDKQTGASSIKFTKTAINYRGWQNWNVNVLGWDSLKFWQKAALKSATEIEVRIYTNAAMTVYFKRYVTIDVADTWEEKILPLASGWTEVGSPSWATVKYIEFRMEVGNYNIFDGIHFYGELMHSFPFISVEYERDYSLEAQPFQVVLPTIENVVKGGTINIYRDNDLVYKGKIYEIEKQKLRSVETVVSGYDLKLKSKFLPAVNRKATTYPGTQIINNLPNTDLSQGTINDYGGSLQMEYGSKGESRFNRKRVFEELAFVTGWEINVAPSGTLNFKSQCGVNRSGTIRFNRGELLLDWFEPYLESDLQKLDRATVIGNKQGAYLCYGIASTAGYGAGSPEKVFDRKNLVSSSTCGTAATSLLADHQNTLKKATIKVVDTFEGRAYDVFDTIKVKDNLLEIDENLRIYHLKKRFSEKLEETKLGLANIQHLNTNGLLLANPGESYLERIALGVDNFGKTKQEYLYNWMSGHQLFFDGFKKLDLAVWEEIHVGGSAEATHETGLPALKLQTSATNGNSGEIRTLTAYWGNAVWCLAFKIKISSNTAVNFRCGAFASGGGAIIYALYFYFQNGALYARTQNGGVGSDTQVDLGAFDATTYHVFRIERISASEANFYVDDELKAIITTNIPSTDMMYDIDIGTTEDVNKILYARTVLAQEAE